MKFEPAKRVKAKAKQNYTLELLIALEMVYSCCLSLWGNLYVLDFHQKTFITSAAERNSLLSTCGQSYKSSTIVFYDSRVVPDLNIPHIMTLDS